MGKKIRVNKNKKKSWRKYGDTSDVEAFLDQKRLQERHGGVAHDIVNKKLFTIDKIGVEENERPFKSQRYLQPLNNFPPVTNLCQKFTPKSRRAQRHAHKRAIVKKNKDIVHKEYSNSQSSVNEFKDLWATNESEETKSIGELEFIPKVSEIKVPAHHFLRPSKLAAIPLPHPGTSYNPVFEDHQALLKQIHVMDIEEQKQEEKILRKAKNDPLPPEILEDLRFKEMCEGLPLDTQEAVVPDNGLKNVTLNTETSNEDLPPGEETRTLAVLTLPKISRDKKKTRAQKRKKGQLKYKEKDRIERKLKKSKLNDINMLNVIVKQIERDERRAKEKLDKKHQRERLVSDGLVTKRLGKYKFTEGEPVFQLGHELADRFTHINPQGSIMLDFFKGLHRRNILEVSKGHAMRSQHLNKNVRLRTDRKTKKQSNKKRTTKFVRNAFKELNV